jgi:hypothetical protein
VGAFSIGRLVLAMAALLGAGHAQADHRPVSVDSKVAAALLREASGLKEATCRPLESGWPPSAWRYSCSLPQAWAWIDIRVAADGTGFKVIPGRVRDLPHARHRTPRFFGAFDVSGVVCAPRESRLYLCDARYGWSGGGSMVEALITRTRYGSLLSHCRLTSAEAERSRSSLYSCQALSWDVNQPTSTVKGMAEMAREARRERSGA